MLSHRTRPIAIVLSVAVFCALLLSAPVAVYAQAGENPDPVLELEKWKGAWVVKGEVLVRFKKSVVHAAARAEVREQAGARKIEALPHEIERLRFDNGSLDDTIEALGSMPGVLFAEPNFVYKPFHVPDDPFWSQQWGPKKIECDDAWDHFTGSPGALVALIDTGVDMNHSDLVPNYAGGYDFYGNDSNPNDTNGHGTLTAGIAAAATNNLIGVAGVAHDCRFLSYRAGKDAFAVSTIIQCINEAKSSGALVISMSFGSTSKSSSMETAIDAAYSAGCVCVAAAGNSGNTSKHYPAAYSRVIAVAASKSNDSRASFSTYGSWVSVAAPGKDIVSTWNSGGYTISNGTSMACPHVAGAAVLLYSLLGSQRTQANAWTVRNAIQTSAVDVGTWVKHGRLDVEAAMEAIAPSMTPEISQVSPALVKSFMGGNVILTGDNFSLATEVQCGDVCLSAPAGFTIDDDQTIFFPAPEASMLGITEVRVSNAWETSNPGYLTYIENDPPVLSVADLAPEGQMFAWSFGGGADDFSHLLVSLDNTTFTYYGFPVLLQFIIINSQSLDTAGLGSLEIQIPLGLNGIIFQSQVATFDQGTGLFRGTSNIGETTITY